VGEGSYTTQFPGVDQAGRNSFPSGTPYTIGKAANKPVPTNDWWSAQIKNGHTDNLFNYPYTLKSINNGLVVSYMPWGVIDDQLPVIVGVEGLNTGTANISDFSDWTVTMDWSNGNHNFQATSGIGMPFLYFTKATTDIAKITVNGGSVTIDNEMMIITNAHNGADFAVYAPSGSNWDKSGNTYTSSLNGNDYWSMAFIPQNAPNVVSVANEYKKHAYVFPTNTTTSWNYDESTSVMRTDFVVETDVKEGSETNMLMGLLPHQWDNLSADSPSLSGYSYPTVRGILETIESNSFSVENTFYGILPTLPYLDNYSEGFSLQKLNEKTKLLENEGLATWTDSYNQGQEMNRLIQTARISDLTGDDVGRDKILKTVKERLEDWLSAEIGEVAFIFYYNDTWSSLIGYPAGHGQDSNINDHHFHWGYFIHAAAFVEQFEPGWSSKWGEMIDHLVRDAANDDRDDSMYPFLRNFSPYAGHCWANGFATFPQGNDQESTSESMQFNSSLIHWGAVTGNKKIRDLGIYLYTTEQTAIEEYWLDVNERNFGPSHPYSLVSRVWGNSYDNGTFWTSDIAASYGIELYPIHGGSLYLGHNTDYVQKLWSEIASNTGILNNEANDNLWHDVMWEYLSFIDPAQAIEMYDSYPERSLKFGVTDAQTYHWLHAMNALGTVDITVTSDNPISAAFNKFGALTYVAHNYKDTPVDVTFSDGYVLTVPAMSMATSRDLSIIGDLSSNFDQAYTGGNIDLNLSVTGGTPDMVEFFEGDTKIGQLSEAPYEFKATGLANGIHSYHAKIYLDGKFSISNLVSVQVGDQAPFQFSPIKIPGSFQAAHFDVFEGGNGQNISYNDITPQNIGGFRADESVDAFQAGAEGDAVGWISSGEWLEFTVDVEEPGYYTLDFRYACGNPGGGGPFLLETDGKSITPEIPVNDTGGWNTWATKSVADIPLKKGKQVLRIFFNNGELNLAKLTFSYDSPLDYNQPIADAGEDMLVVLPQSSTVLDGSNSSVSGGETLSYKWNQIYGPTVLSFSDPNSAQPMISPLEEGVYKLELTVDNGDYFDTDEVLIISNSESNFAPEVHISSPSNNSSFLDGSSISISATATDLGGSIVNVEFFIDGESIGTDTDAPYENEWTPTSLGEYSITAVATDNDGGSTTSESVSISILDKPTIEGTWRMASEEFALGVGPTIGDLGWWNCPSACIQERACYFDDEYIFEPGGAFINNQGNETWVESWQDGSPEGCRSPVAPHDGSNDATWSLDGNQLTLNGLGAYIGLAKVYNGGELGSNDDAQSSISYPVEINAEGNRMTIDIDFGAGFWHFVLIKDPVSSNENIANEKFQVYPNPANSQLTFDLPSGENKIVIFDLTGKMLANFTVNGNNYTHDINNFPAGLYIIKLQNEENIGMIKIVKE